MVVAILSNSSPGNKLGLLISHNGLQIWAPICSAFTGRACTDGQGGESPGTSGIFTQHHLAMPSNKDTWSY